MWLTPEEIWLFNQGKLLQPYTKLGAHPLPEGTWFAVWAPHAERVSVIGDWNGWDPKAHPLSREPWTGIWTSLIPEAQVGQRYKYRIQSPGFSADKTDPYAFQLEPPQGTPLEGLASVITRLEYTWGDEAWMRQRKGPSGLQGPLAIYEVHLGSWRRKEGGWSLSYREIADPLIEHVQRLGFTHVEFLPLMEHPYYPSWGYQVLGYYAPSHRYGRPEDLMYLIDRLHQAGIGVIFDWVPAHFATDPQGLVYFDGSCLYEYEDPRLRYHPDWGTYIFDWVKPGVRNFLIGNALFWLERYHVDGLRVDAVASMLYRDYSRPEGAWAPNMFGGRENLEAIDFLKEANEAVYSFFPEAIMVAEESTAWPKVSFPTYDGGLGFLYKWNMGWMHDTLEYFKKDPIHRKYHQDWLTFSLVYAFSEHFILPLSHDEVVHGKGSLWQKMPGDDWQKAANLRLLFGHWVGHPGKKLLFMGSEFGQPWEWSHDGEVPFDLRQDPLHGGLDRWLIDLLALYRHPALYDDSPQGFEWIDFQDREQSVLIYLRRGGGAHLLFVFNFTPVPRDQYRIGVPHAGPWRERLNSDATLYGGSGVGNFGAVATSPIPWHGRPYSLVLKLPPLGLLVLSDA